MEDDGDYGGPGQKKRSYKVKDERVSGRGSSGYGNDVGFSTGFRFPQLDTSDMTESQKIERRFD